MTCSLYVQQKIEANDDANLNQMDGNSKAETDAASGDKGDTQLLDEWDRANLNFKKDFKEKNNCFK